LDFSNTSDFEGGAAEWDGSELGAAAVSKTILVDMDLLVTQEASSMLRRASVSIQPQLHASILRRRRAVCECAANHPNFREDLEVEPLPSIRLQIKNINQDTSERLNLTFGRCQGLFP
jgi:hypothetical protein